MTTRMVPRPAAPARVREAALRLAVRAADPVCAYVYDLQGLAASTRRLRNQLPAQVAFYYAVKANADAPILRTIAPYVDGFEVASGGELRHVRRLFPGAPVVFGGPGKTDAELRAALLSGVEFLHVESLMELERLAHAARAEGRVARVLLRVNLPLADLPDAPLAMGGRPTPFGIDADLVPACLTWLRDHPEVTLHGFHLHLLSGQLDASAHLRLVSAYGRQLRAWRDEHGLNVRHLNVGGGIGVNYRDPARPFDWATFTRGLHEVLRGPDWAGVRVRFELGRAVTAACGYYAMQVLDVKRTFGRTFVVARGGTHHFRTPAAQGHDHPFEVLRVDHWPHPYARPRTHGENVTVVGQLCTPKDVLARDVPCGQVRAGDVLLFHLAGAYAWSISHHAFLMHDPPAFVYLDEHEAPHGRPVS